MTDLAVIYSPSNRVRLFSKSQKHASKGEEMWCHPMSSRETKVLLFARESSQASSTTQCSRAHTQPMDSPSAASVSGALSNGMTHRYAYNKSCLVRSFLSSHP